MKSATIGDRLVRARTQLGLTQEEMSVKSGIPLSTLKKYEGDDRTPGGEALAALANAGIDITELLTGNDEVKRLRAATMAVTKAALERSHLSSDQLADLQQRAYESALDAEGVGRLMDSMPHRAEQPRAGYTYIPLLDVAAQAGAGRVVETEAVVDVLAFKEDWIRQELRKSPDDLRLIYVDGDSMEPDLRSGDIVLVDHTDTSARRDGVYVMRMDGALLVKQLQRLPGGGIKAVSRNASYEPFTITQSDLQNGFAIIGRVVWACRRF